MGEVAGAGTAGKGLEAEATEAAFCGADLVLWLEQKYTV